VPGRVLDDLSALRAAIADRIAGVRSGAIGLREALQPMADESVAALASRFVYVVKVVEAVPGVGKVRARRALDAVGLGERDRVGDLSVDVRAALLRELA
jgi:hypothetical protein